MIKVPKQIPFKSM